MRGKRILINPIDDYCDLKGELFMAIVVKPGTLHEKAGFIEYKMPEAMAKAYLNGRTAEEKKMRPNDFLCIWLAIFWNSTASRSYASSISPSRSACNHFPASFLSDRKSTRLNSSHTS